MSGRRQMLVRFTKDSVQHAAGGTVRRHSPGRPGGRQLPSAGLQGVIASGPTDWFGRRNQVGADWVERANYRCSVTSRVDSCAGDTGDGPRVGLSKAPLHKGIDDPGEDGRTASRLPSLAAEAPHAGARGRVAAVWR